MKTRFIFLLLLLSAPADAARRSPPVRSKLVQATLNPRAANEAFIGGDYPRAVQLYTSLLASTRLGPEAREEIYLNRGYSNLRMGRLNEAEADLRQAMALNPDDAEAAAGLHALQNRVVNGRPASSPPSTLAPEVAIGWGPLAKLPGRQWIISTTKPVSTLRYEWGRVGVSMIFGGKDAAGNRLEGQYFIDPATNTIRVSSIYRGSLTAAPVNLSRSEFRTAAPGNKKGQRQVAQVQPDGTFTLITEKAKDNGWERVSIATIVPASEQMVAALAWPNEPPPKKPSFMRSMLSSMKEGALEGLRDGTRQGLQDTVQHRVRQVTGTPLCRTLSGEIIRCP